jgi:hypothetical protein
MHSGVTNKGSISVWGRVEKMKRVFQSESSAALLVFV